MSPVTKRCLLVSLFALLAAGGCGPSTLSHNEAMVFQNTACYQLPESGMWTVDMRAAVFSKSFLNRLEPDVVEYLEAHKFLPDSTEATLFEKRLAPFLASHPRNMTLEIVIGGKVQPIGPTDSSGRIMAPLILTGEELARLRSEPGTAPGWIQYRLRMAEGDHRECIGRARILEPRGLSIVSDIDDTIKITDVNNTKKMLQNTFLKPFRPVPGMPELYAGWQTKTGATFHYLSESSIELYPPLSEFLSSAGFPAGTVDLREIAWEHSRLKGLVSMAEAPPEFKLSELRRMIDASPSRAYVLVGDSSQHDPEVYAETARKYPAQVRRILIHDVTCEGPDSPRYKETFRDLPISLWQIYRDPEEIRDAIPASAI